MAPLTMTRSSEKKRSIRMMRATRTKRILEIWTSGLHGMGLKWDYNTGIFDDDMDDTWMMIWMMMVESRQI